MNETRTTSIPQFSLRVLLAITAVVALLAVAASWAFQGNPWGVAIVAGVATTLVAFGVYAVIFAFAWLIAIAFRHRPRPPSSSSTASQHSDLAPDAAGSASSEIGKAVMLLLGAVIWLNGASAARASSGGSITLPYGSAPNTTGLELTIDTTWVDSSGYRPVRVSLVSTGGASHADRVLTLRFMPRIGLTLHTSITVEQEVELPAGESKVETTIAVPQLSMWGSFVLETYEAGQYVEELSVPENVTWTSWAGTYAGDLPTPAVLMLSGGVAEADVKVGSASPEVIFFVPSDESLGLSGTATGSSPLGSPARLYSDLPKRWIDYSGIDLAMASLPDLVKLADKNTAAWRAIHLWLNNGGTLVVFGVGEQWQDLDRLEALLDLPSPPDSQGEENGSVDPAQHGWKPPDRAIQLHPLQGVGNTNTQQADTLNSAVKLLLRSGNAARPPFLTRASGLGLVAAIGSDGKFNAAAFNWNWLYNTIGPERWQWSMRYGVSLHRPNQDYWNFMIPGIGLPPVRQFQAIITLFVIVIGPVAYYWFRRRGILNLLVVAVPTAALVVTLAMFAYAYLADGLGVRVRARSFTHIDQRRGQAACWARLAYYAGIAPAGGLTFTDDMIVLPLELNPQSNPYGPYNASRDRAERFLDWKQQSTSKFASSLVQQLTEGWLQSRTTAQFITSRIRDTAARLEIQPLAPGKPLEVINKLGVPIEQLVLVDGAGKCWTGSNVEVDAARALAPANSQSSALHRQLSTAWNENRPYVSDEIAMHLGVFRSGQLAYRAVDSPNLPDAAQSTGMLERSLAALVDALGADRLEPRTYIAIAAMSPEVELGIEGVDQEASFHVIVGRW